MKRFGVVSTVVGCMVLFSPPSQGMDWLNELDLRSQCAGYLKDPESRAGVLCEAFIQGYLSGIQSLQQEVDKKLEKKRSPTGDSYSDRAIRMRVGSRLRFFDRSLDGGFCIANDQSPDKVVRLVVSYFNAHQKDTPLPDNKILFNALLENFPCDEE